MIALEAPLRPRLSLKLLGGFSATLDGRPLPPFPYDKLRALLVYLALDPAREFSRAELAEMFWPEQDGEAARGNLRRALSNLRAALGDRSAASGYFQINRTALRIRPGAPLDIDIADLATPPIDCEGVSDSAECRACLLRMERSTAAYVGELMAGFSLPDCAEFEQWLRVRRENLHRHALQLLDRLIACCMARGEPAGALSFALRYIELEPWNENAVQRAMRLLAEAGEPAAALAQFDALRQRIGEQLGIAPGEEICRLAQQIRQGGAAGRKRVPPGEALPASRSESTPPAERRQVTAVYCEFSAASSEDPDDLAETLPFAREAAALLERRGGYLVPNHCGVLAYFGYPQASEHVPQQAVRAARAVAGAAAAAGVAVRLGVHTGLIVTGGEASLFGAFAQPLNLAARLPALVDPGVVALSAATHRLVADYFQCRALGRWTLRDLPRPLEVFGVIGESGIRHRLRAVRRRLTPFVGREAELDHLLAAWQRVQRGGQAALLLTGEPGIGKSRLLQALRERIDERVALTVELCCQAESAEEALHPLASALFPLIGAAPEDAAEVLRDKLAAAARQFFPEREEDARQLGAWLLGLGEVAGGAESAPPPADERARAFAALFDLLACAARRQPLLLIVEDLSWADPSTRELIDLLVARAAPQRILLVATARPEFVPDWPAGRYERLALGQLPGDAAQSMIRGIADGRCLTDGVVRRIVELADGVPLFVEETARLLIDSACQATIPSSLRDLLAARLDALGAAKAVAQCAAVVGRVFQPELLGELGELAGLAPDAVERGLASMEAAGVIVRDAANCQFRHALIREVAYDSLPRRQRRAMHLHIARTLSARTPQLAESQPGLLAWHYTGAGEAEPALAFHLQAARLALRHSAYREVIAHFRQALVQLKALPESTERHGSELEILAGLGNALGAVEGFGASATREVYERALQLCRASTASPRLFQMLYGMWRGSSSWSDFRWSLQLGNELLNIAEESGNRHCESLACYALGNVHCFLGEFAASRSYLMCCVERYRPEMPEEFCGDSAGANGWVFLGWVLTLQGEFGAGLAHAREALALARRDKSPAVLCFLLIMAAELHRLRREPAPVERYATEALALAERFGLAAWGAFAHALLGWCDVAGGRAAGIVRVRQCLEAVQGGIMASSATPLLSILGEACLTAGEHAAGLAAADAGLASCERHLSRYLKSSLLRLKGELLLAQGAAAEARACLGAALDTARQQGARLFELHAAIALACHAAGDEVPDARERLRHLLAQWRPDSDLPCRDEAQALLAAGTRGTRGGAARAKRNP